MDATDASNSHCAESQPAAIGHPRPGQRAPRKEKKKHGLVSTDPWKWKFKFEGKTYSLVKRNQSRDGSWHLDCIVRGQRIAKSLGTNQGDAAAARAIAEYIRPAKQVKLEAPREIGSISRPDGKGMTKPRIQHIPLHAAANRLGHSTRWVRDRIKRGVFEAFKHSRNDVTISERSIQAYEDSVRISGPPTHDLTSKMIFD